MFELNPDTRLMTDLLLAMEQGSSLSYAAISREMGREVTGSDPYLQSARRRAEKEDGFVFEFERKKGIRRLTDPEIVALGESGAKSLRSKARRTAKKISNVKDFDGLTDAQKAQHNGALALLGAIASASKASTLRRLEKASSESAQPLPIGRTFELFKAS